MNQQSWTLLILICVLVNTHGARPVNAQCDLKFSTDDSFSVGEDVRSMVLEDLDGDGFADLIATNRVPDTISVALNDAAGGFKAAMSYSAGLSTRAATAVDLDHDDDIDIVAAAGGSDAIAVLLNQGDGTFTAASLISVQDRPTGVAHGYLNDDGHVDIVTSHFFDDVLTIRLGRGDGTFEPQTIVTAPSVSGPWLIRLADLNGDDHIDAVTSNWHMDSASVFFGNGTGNLVFDRTEAAVPEARGLAVADIDGDGDMDFAIGSNLDTANAVVIRFNNGSGTFPNEINLVAGSSPGDVSIADLNNDQRPDLVVANAGDDSVSIFQQTDLGGFQLVTTLPTGVEPFATAVGDIDNDGDIDVVTSGRLGGVTSVFTNVICCADLTGNHVVNLTDLLILLALWGDCDGKMECDADLDGNGIIDLFDLLQLLDSWGEC